MSVRSRPLPLGGSAAPLLPTSPTSEPRSGEERGGSLLSIWPRSGEKRGGSLLLVLLGSLASLLVACPSSHPPDAPVVPSPLLSELEGACDRLIALGCPEGFPGRTGRTCVETMQSVLETGVVVPAACLSRASDQDSVRACGDPSTLRVRCILPEGAR